MSKQTAVQLLKRDLDSEMKSGTKMVVNWDMYLEVEKQQIIDAAERWKGTKFAEQYYNETYGGNHIVDTNEIIDHIGDANKMVEISEEKPMRYHCVPKEISDEEIGKGCDENIPLDEADMWSERLYFRIGAKWYREQIKNKL